MKQKLLSAMAALMLLPALAACSGQQNTDETIKATAAATETVTEPIAETSASFEEIILADNDACTVKITGIVADNLWGYTLNVYLENKTDKELMFSVDDASVNGYMCDPFWASTVAAGKKSNEEISFSESDFEKNGITEVTDITFTMKVYDADDWSAEHLLEESFTINP